MASSSNASTSPTDMKRLEFSICAGIGDNITARIYLDAIKHHYDEIRISHDKNVIRAYRDNDPRWMRFLDEIGNALFNTRPYVFDHFNHPAIQWHQVRQTIRGHNAAPSTPQLASILCS